MKNLFSILAAVIFIASAWAQAPQLMSYQAVIRDASNNLVTNHAIGMRVSILQGSTSGTLVYQEIYNPNPQTNANGLVSIAIGGGIPITGTFANINWATNSYFIKTETDPTGGTNYTITGTSQLLSVPYALYSQYSQKSGLLAGSNIKISNDSINNTAPDQPVTITGNSAIRITGTYPNFTINYQSATFRWNVFSSYDQGNSVWMGAAGGNANGDPNMFLGVTPQLWGDVSATAESISSDKEVLRTFFINKAYAGKNAMVYSDTWSYYSSTNSKMAVVLFRISNTTNAAINWTPYFYYTSYESWGELASVALNGTAVWNAGANTYGTASPTMSIPANSVSSVIVISGSSVPSGTRTCFLAFYNNCLQLPTGLQFVDDLDTATGGWGQ